MLNTPRERALAVITACCLTAAVGWESCSTLLLQPLNGLEQELQTAKTAVENSNFEELRLMQAIKKLRTLRTASLPADPGQAAAVYQAWLVQQLEAAGLQTPSVNPVQAIPDEALGHRLPFSVECTGTAAAIGDFIDRFSAANLLHRMTSLQITSVSMGVDDSLQLAVSIEAIALPEAPSVDSLPSEFAPADPTSTLQNALADNNIFTGVPAEFQSDPPIVTAPVTPELPIADTAPSETELQAPAEAGTETAPYQLTAAEACRFAGSILTGKTRRAWFVDLRTGDIYWAGRNQSLAIPDLPLPVLAVTDDAVIVEYCADPRIIPLGNSVVTPSVLPEDLQAFLQPPPAAKTQRSKNNPDAAAIPDESMSLDSTVVTDRFPQPDDFSNANPAQRYQGNQVPTSARPVPALPRPATSVLR